MEWGCMQALIDFDGWRKWKDFSSQSNQSNKPSSTSTSTPLLSTGTGTGKSPKSSSGLANANGKVVPPGGGGAGGKKKKEEREGLHLGLVGKEKVAGVEEAGSGREREGSDETTGTAGTETDTNGDEEGK